MITLNTNLASMIVQTNLQKSTNALNTAIKRMTSGYKINGAKDNAANYSITTNMTTKIGAYQVAEDNVTMGLDLLSTASENLDLIFYKLTRIRALAEQAANGTYGEQSNKAINAEVNALVDEIERLYNTTEYNGIKLYKDEKPEKLHDAVIPEDALRVSEVTSFQLGKTYTLSSKEDLIALQDLVSTGRITMGITFVMTNDIDMSDAYFFTGIGLSNSKTFRGTFDGNGYAIKNLTINTPDRVNVGLFGYSNGTIKNLGLENCDITGQDYVGGLTGYNSTGGSISNSYVTGSVTGDTNVGDLAGRNNGTITNSSAISSLELTNSSFMKSNGLTEENGWYFKDGYAPQLTPFLSDMNIGLQVGIDSSEHSGISLTTSFALPTISQLRGIGLYDGDYISQIDFLLENVSAKQTQYGAVQNRLESALEEILTQYENLVSSRSTLRDADIAKVSSEYIRQQILQQASAALLATANQSHALALQLI